MNTHYNQIDTLITLVGAEKWQIIVNVFLKSLPEVDTNPDYKNVSNWISNNKGVGVQASETQKNNHGHFSRMFNEFYVDWASLESELGMKSLPNQVRYTLSELFIWAMTEGDRVGLSYGFRKSN